MLTSLDIFLRTHNNHTEIHYLYVTFSENNESNVLQSRGFLFYIKVTDTCLQGALYGI